MLGEEGVGCIAFSPLAQGMLTDAATSTASRRTRAPPRARSSTTDLLTDENLAHVRALNDIAARRGQTLAQMAIAWVLRDPRVTSALIGASQRRAARGQRSARSTTSTSPTTSCREIDEHAVEAGINLWAASSEN